MSVNKSGELRIYTDQGDLEGTSQEYNEYLNLLKEKDIIYLVKENQGSILLCVSGIKCTKESKHEINCYFFYRTEYLERDLFSKFKKKLEEKQKNLFIRIDNDTFKKLLEQIDNPVKNEDIRGTMIQISDPNDPIKSRSKIPRYHIPEEYVIAILERTINTDIFNSVAYSFNEKEYSHPHGIWFYSGTENKVDPDIEKEETPIKGKELTIEKGVSEKTEQTQKIPVSKKSNGGIYKRFTEKIKNGIAERKKQKAANDEKKRIEEEKNRLAEEEKQTAAKNEKDNVKQLIDNIKINKLFEESERKIHVDYIKAVIEKIEKDQSGTDIKINLLSIENLDKTIESFNEKLEGELNNLKDKQEIQDKKKFSKFEKNTKENINGYIREFKDNKGFQNSYSKSTKDEFTAKVESLIYNKLDEVYNPRPEETTGALNSGIDFVDKILLPLILIVFFIVGLAYFQDQNNTTTPGSINNNTSLTPTPSPTKPETQAIPSSITSGEEQPPPDNKKNSIGMEFVLITDGTFMMGSPESEGSASEEKPQHEVTIHKFYIGKYEITQKQWKEVMGDNSSVSKGDNLPVVQVSWNKTQEFIKKLNGMEYTTKYRLPSEAEWEYAARAGTTTRYSFGDDESKLNDFAVCNHSSIQTVDTKRQNNWGLFDMHGNVYELVQDMWHKDYVGAPNNGSAWEDGPNNDKTERVIRGGTAGDISNNCRSARRKSYPQGDSNYEIGFRLAMDI